MPLLPPIPCLVPFLSSSRCLFNFWPCFSLFLFSFISFFKPYILYSSPADIISSFRLSISTLGIPTINKSVDMKFITAVLALATVAFAYPAVNMNAPVKRQNIVTADASVPAMSDGSGNVVPFDATKVVQARRKI